MHAELHCLTPPHRSIWDSEPERRGGHGGVHSGRLPFADTHSSQEMEGGVSESPRKLAIKRGHGFDMRSLPGLPGITQAFPALKLRRKHY